MAKVKRKPTQKKKPAAKKPAAKKPAAKKPAAKKPAAKQPASATSKLAQIDSGILRYEVNAVIKQLGALAKSYGYDARLESVNNGDREREKSADALYERYWKSLYEGVWLAAIGMVLEPHRPYLDDITAAGHDLFMSATRSAAATTRYADGLHAEATDQGKRLTHVRFFDGSSSRCAWAHPVVADALVSLGVPREDFHRL